MKELILDGFFRCSGCGRRYHLTDTLEKDAFCDECGQSLAPEIEEDPEETDNDASSVGSKSDLVSEEFPESGGENSRNKAKTGPEQAQNRSITGLELLRNDLKTLYR